MDLDATASKSLKNHGFGGYSIQINEKYWIWMMEHTNPGFGFGCWNIQINEKSWIWMLQHPNQWKNLDLDATASKSTKNIGFGCWSIQIIEKSSIWMLQHPNQ